MNVCLWMRIPKTGSTALHSRFAAREERLVGGGPLTFSECPRAILLRCGHWTPRKLVEERVLTEEAIRKSFTFSVVRNPWARMVSLFYGIGRQWKWTDDFERFVMDILADPSRVASEEGTPLMTSMSDWLLLDGTPVCELVLKMERLNDDYPALAARLGINSSPLGVYNQHDHPPYPEVHTSATREAIGAHDQWVIERFGYRFGEDTKGEIFGE